MMNKVAPADLPAEERPELDAGIAEVVQLLAEGGFHTTDSGDGVSKPADERVFNVPHVAATVAPEVLIAESERMARLLGDQWHVQATYSPDDKTAVLLATRDAPAPAEERETPVEPESVICDMCGRMVFWNALAHRICIEDGQVKVLACHSVIAEDRAVTAPQEPDDRWLSVDMLDVDRLREWARLILVHGADITHWGSVPYVASKMQTLATGLEKAIRDIGTLRADQAKLAALTHAIEALREEYANRQPGTVSSDSIFADKLAAILKEWEGRHA
jgi:hypothetical protein